MQVVSYYSNLEFIYIEKEKLKKKVYFSLYKKTVMKKNK